MVTQNEHLNRILPGKIMVEPPIYNSENWKNVNKIVASKVQGNLLNLYNRAGSMM